MDTPEHIRQAKQRRGRERMPRVNLTDCRVASSPGPEGYRVILEGNPVFVGAVPPNIDIGGQSPLRLAYSRDAQVAAGYIASSPETDEAIIDYGFTSDRCPISPAGFRDRVLHWRVTTAASPRSGFAIEAERLAAWLVARLFLIPH